MKNSEAEERGRGYLVATFAILFFFFFVASTATVAQNVQRFVSSKAGDRITPKPVLHFQQDQDPSAVKFEINDDITYQKMDGFGASFLEAGIICLNSLPPSERESVLRALFDPDTGAGFSLMKTVIASTDFMSAGPFYSYDGVPGSPLR